MNTKLKLAGLMLIAGTVVSGQAQGRDPVVGAVLGAGAGAVIGASIGGHEGAAVGGIIGAVAGASMFHPRVIVGADAPVYPVTGQYAGGYVQTHGPVYGPAGGYRDSYPDGRYDDRRGYNRYPGYGAPPAVVRYPAPVLVVPGHGYYGAPAPVIVSPPPQVVYREPYPYHHRHHDRYCRHHPRDWRAY